jgi:hypothetical protein
VNQAVICAPLQAQDSKQAAASSYQGRQGKGQRYQHYEKVTLMA